MDEARTARSIEENDAFERPSWTIVVRAAAAGDNVATTALLRRLSPQLASTVRAVLGPTHPDLDDAIQQALLGFVQALPAFRGECSALGYARAIAVRAALALRRRGHVREQRRDDVAEADAIPASRPSPGDDMAARQRKDLLRDLLDELPPEQAETLALRVILGCSLEEVALQTGAPLNTVRSRLRLAKERLKARIEGDPTLFESLGGRR
jgi:RNA polymerase sigma-70 factor (ECF subfamily)